MKNLLLVLATFAALTVKSQTSVYHPFPDSNAVWNVQTQLCCYNSCSSPFPNPYFYDFNFSYYLQGDTTANGYNYHKIYQSGVTHEYCAFSTTVNNWGTQNNLYVGAYREDAAAKKVFLMGTPDILLYDFSLNVGDTVPRGFELVDNCSAISSIDSILIGNNYRKRFNLSTFPYSLIEGIGSTSGLLEPLCVFEYEGTLICFSQNGQTLFPDTNTNCENVTNVHDVQYKTSIKVFPNPFLNELNFSTGNYDQSELVIYDITSRKLLNKTFINSISFNTQQLFSGVYLYEVRYRNGLATKGKIVKN
jgi:hypothetical protein